MKVVGSVAPGCLSSSLPTPYSCCYSTTRPYQEQREIVWAVDDTRGRGAGGTAGAQAGSREAAASIVRCAPRPAFYPSGRGNPRPLGYLHRAARLSWCPCCCGAAGYPRLAEQAPGQDIYTDRV